MKNQMLERKLLGGIEKETKNSFFDNQLLGYKDAAQFLGISESYLRRLKSRGGIPYVKIGIRGVRFKLNSLSEWVQKREIK